jgi:Ca2+/Na+ antiporter
MPDQVLPVEGVVARERGPLAWAMAAPQPPGARGAAAVRRPSRARRWLLWALVTLLPVDLVLLALFAAFAVAIGVVLGIVLLVALAVYLVYLLVTSRHRRERREAEAARQRRYQHALGFWYQLRFCRRCQGVFLPGNEWQHPEVVEPGGLTAPGYAWRLAVQLAEHAERHHGTRASTGP